MPKIHDFVIDQCFGLLEWNFIPSESSYCETVQYYSLVRWELVCMSNRKSYFTGWRSRSPDHSLRDVLPQNHISCLNNCMVQSYESVLVCVKRLPHILEPLFLRSATNHLLISSLMFPVSCYFSSPDENDISIRTKENLFRIMIQEVCFCESGQTEFMCPFETHGSHISTCDQRMFYR